MYIQSHIIDIYIIHSHTCVCVYIYTHLYINVYIYNRKFICMCTYAYVIYITYICIYYIARYIIIARNYRGGGGAIRTDRAAWQSIQAVGAPQ